MSAELEKREDMAVQVAPGDLLTAIARSASDPGVDVVKMQALYEMHKDMLREQHRIEFDEAMARLQAKLPQFDKFGKAKNSKFAKLEDIDTIVRPLLNAEDFSIVCSEESRTETTVTFVLTISKGGHDRTVRGTFSIDRAAKNSQGASIRPAIQDDGSTMSYARRYLLKLALNIIETDADNDGNPTEKISAEQARDIETAIADTGSNKEKFLKLIAGVDSVSSILARDYKRVMNALEEKARAKK